LFSVAVLLLVPLVALHAAEPFRKFQGFENSASVFPKFIRKTRWSNSKPWGIVQ